MKIVHAANFSLRRKAPFFYGIPYKLTNGLIRLGHTVLNFCDRDIARSYFTGIPPVGRQYANQSLIRICQQMRPDLLLLGHCRIISPETVLRIRAAIPGIKIAHWSCDALFLPDTIDRLRDLVPIVDATFVTTAGRDLMELASHGGLATYMPNPVDSSIETLRVFDHESFENDLIFVTGKRQYTTEKADICKLVQIGLPSLNFRVHGLFGKSEVYGAEYFEVLQRSKMALNISARNDVHLYSSDRIAQLVGCGLLTFVDRRTGYDSIFSSDELVFFEGIGDLLEKLAHFNENDQARRDVARRGWQKAHGCFSEIQVAQWIVDVAFRASPSRGYAWPTDIYGETAPEKIVRKRTTERSLGARSKQAISSLLMATHSIAALARAQQRPIQKSRTRFPESNSAMWGQG